MKKKYIVLIAIVVVVLTIAIFFAFKIRKNKTSDIFATYNGGVVYVKDVEDYLKKLGDAFNQEINLDNLKLEEKKQLADEIVNNRIILERAKASDISKSEKYKNRVKEIEELVLQEMFIQKMVEKEITEEVVRAEYEKERKEIEGKKEYKVRQIVAKTKGDIQKVINKLRTETFEEVAKSDSIDVETSENGGDLGYILDGQTIPEFENVVKLLPLNKLSQPFETKMGWHVIIKEDERVATVPEFEKMKNFVRNSMIARFIRNYSLNNLKDMNVELKK